MTTPRRVPLELPDLDALEAIAARDHLNLSRDDLAAFRTLMEGMLASYHRVDELTTAGAAARAPRTKRRAWRPESDDNPLGAWYWRAELGEPGSGPLAGKRLAVKDNVCVADVPMMNGTQVLEGFTPESDATVVTRVLDSGGEILGKAVCESLCFSAGSHTSDSGPVRNPFDRTRMAGGSSSGAAALIASGAVDMAIGGDQGGSIRIPASWCGVYGLKPTHGLVPYTGIFPIETTLDHTGPMAGTVADVALLLECIAGPDGLDPRQSAMLQPQRYTQAIGAGAKGLRIGIVAEGFGMEGQSEADVDAAVRKAGAAFADLGAEVQDISIPWHRDGLHIWNGVAVEGATAMMIAGNAMGTNWKGHFTTDLQQAFAEGRRSRADALSPTVKLVMLLGRHMLEQHDGVYYGKAQNLARQLTAAYDTALGEVDVLLMPTTPMKATKIPAADAPREEIILRGLEMLANTAPFDVTGHPAMNVPCALSDGLPVGMMLIGRHGDEATVLRAADAFASGVFARPLPPETAS